MTLLPDRFSHRMFKGGLSLSSETVVWGLENKVKGLKFGGEQLLHMGLCFIRNGFVTVGVVLFF